MGAFSALRRRPVSLIAVGLGSLTLSACPVDERVLGAGGAPLGASNAGAAGEGAADGFHAAFESSGEGGGDARGVVGRWGFDHDTGDFTAEDKVDQSWGELDADGNPRSGTLVITNKGIGSGEQYHARGSTVCRAAAAGVKYDVSAKVFIDRAQDSGSAGFVFQFFNAPGCEGLGQGLTIYSTATTARWVVGEKTYEAPEGTQSVLLRLIASKLEASPPFTARFDDVSFLAE